MIGLRNVLRGTGGAAGSSGRAALQAVATRAPESTDLEVLLLRFQHTRFHAFNRGSLACRLLRVYLVSDTLHEQLATGISYISSH